jgi:hypothetical protein
VQEARFAPGEQIVIADSAAYVDNASIDWNWSGGGTSPIGFALEFR